MWSIFDNEDFSLRTDKNRKEKYETKVRRKRTYERMNMNRSRSFMSSSRRPFSSFSHFGSANYTSASVAAAARFDAWKRSIRRRFRITKSTLLKLIKIINKFPQIESEDKKEMNIDTDLIKKLNKIVSKIDIQNLKTKKNIRKGRTKSSSLTIDGMKRKLSSRRSFGSNYIMPLQSSYNFRNSTNLQKRKIIRHNLMFNSTSNTNHHLRRIGQKISNDNFGILYSNNFKNKYQYYMNFKNKRAKNAHYYNDTNDVLVTDFFMHSTLNSSSNKLSSMQRKKNLFGLNSFGSSNFRKTNSMIPSHLDKNFKTTSFQNMLAPKNSSVYGNSHPLMSSLTQYVHVPRRNPEKRRLFLTKQLKKFTKEEKIRSLLRTASNEDELVKAMNVAKNAGLTFEAKLGEKKLQKLKTVA